jgi:hypothetical protein
MMPKPGRQGKRGGAWCSDALLMELIVSTKSRPTPFAVETAPTKIAPDANPVGAALAANPGDSVAELSHWRGALLMKLIIATKTL